MKHRVISFFLAACLGMVGRCERSRFHGDAVVLSKFWGRLAGHSVAPAFEE